MHINLSTDNTYNFSMNIFEMNIHDTIPYISSNVNFFHSTLCSIYMSVGTFCDNKRIRNGGYGMKNRKMK